MTVAHAPVSKFAQSRILGVDRQKIDLVPVVNKSRQRVVDQVRGLLTVNE